MKYRKIKTDIPRLTKMPKQLFANTVHIFTDGSCNRLDGSGGWAAVLLYNDKRKEIFGGKRNTTIGEMEMTAILEGLKALKSPNIPVILYSDSQYCVNAVSVWYKGWIKRGWKTADGKHVKHVSIIQEIVAFAEARPIVFKWVKGHNGNEHNERADELATQGRIQLL